MRSPHVTVQIDLDRVRASAEQIRATTGVRLIAVIKADAYGLGAERVADALSDVADEFAYFALAEARALRRPGLILGPIGGPAQEHIDLRVRPAVSTGEQLREYAAAKPVLHIDTGMQRFGCRPDRVDDLLLAHDVAEAFTHTTSPDGAAMLRDLCAGRVDTIHAAATSLLETPDAWLDAVRPGLALYRGAVRVTTRIVDVHDVSGPVGYGGFQATRVGVILAGYSHYLRPAPVLINGRPQRILECGMQTSYVSVDARDRGGDEVTLLGGPLTEQQVATDAQTRPHEVLCRYTAIGERRFEAGS